jgi:uncharacterized protein (DUF849 family)
MWLQACLNGGRTPAEHPAVPLTPEALAEDALRVVAAGADALHLHPRDAAGLESLEPEPVAAALSAVRAACPGTKVGISTAASIEPEVARRVAAIEAWTVLPDYVSVNLGEPQVERVLAALTARGIGLEAGIWTPADARHLLTLTGATWLRLLLEPRETEPAAAEATTDALEAVLGDALPKVPRLLHGVDGGTWPSLRRAARSAYASRIGLEDTLLLPTGAPAPDNAALIRAARTLV